MDSSLLLQYSRVTIHGGNMIHANGTWKKRLEREVVAIYRYLVLDKLMPFDGIHFPTV